MRICVIIPSIDASQQAGVRIRYNRIEEDLATRGSNLRVVPLSDFMGLNAFADDIYIFSKCYDARALLLAQTLKQAGKLTGIDLFDDFFSQSTDSRIMRFRQWLEDMTGCIDFVLCSTPAMANVANGLCHGLPVHVMNDPAPAINVETLQATLRRKIDRAVEERKVRICWFGMGDNPHFPVGLADLVAYCHKLTELEASGYDVSLAIRTNARALTAETLAKLRRIPVPYSIDEWSVETEALLLDQSLICFIPTNGQNFSVVKSLNRALTALTHGAQVFSAGYPLYAPLSPFIYRDAAAIVSDLANKALVLRPETVDQLGRLIDAIGNIRHEASAFVQFLQDLSPVSVPTSRDKPGFAVVHGFRSIEAVHDFGHAAGAITVAGPYCNDVMNFDVVCRFASNTSRIEVLVSERLLPTLPDALVARSAMPQTIGAWKFRSIRLPAEALAVVSASQGKDMSVLDVMAGYPHVMQTVETAVQTLFPGIRCVISDRSVYPYAVRERPATRNEH